jgi:DMSO reductase anchor subunit
VNLQKDLKEEFKKMDALYVLLLMVGAVVGIIVVFAIVRLFSIDKTLKEIRNELLIARTDRQHKN